MKRRSHDERFFTARWLDERGFTLIELLVAMVISIVVIGAGTYGLAQAFSQSTEVTDRANSTSQAEVGLQALTRDIRYATTCPTYNGVNTLGAGKQQVSGVLVSAGPELQMCDPAPGAHASQPPALDLITWTCNTTTTVGTCARSFAAINCPGASATPATGACSSGAPTLATTSSGSTNIAGVTAITISGLVSGVSQSSLLADATCQVATGYYSYGLATSSTCPLSWIGIQARLVALTDPGAATDAANQVIQKKTSPIQIQTGAALRNYGT